MKSLARIFALGAFPQTQTPVKAVKTTLYAAVKAHLRQLGYEAKGEIFGCDVVGDPKWESRRRS